MPFKACPFTELIDSHVMSEDAWLKKYPSWRGIRKGAAQAQLAKQALRSWNTRADAPQPDHPDDVAVDDFAVKMKAKLAMKRADGRGGWEDNTQCTAEFLSHLLREHVDKGDPVDVANLAMMLSMRGEGITKPHPIPDRQAALVDLRKVENHGCGTDEGSGYGAG
jgi:hypothetical protein